MISGSNLWVLFPQFNGQLWITLQADVPGLLREVKQGYTQELVSLIPQPDYL